MEALSCSSSRLPLLAVSASSASSSSYAPCSSGSDQGRVAGCSFGSRFGKFSSCCAEMVVRRSSYGYRVCMRVQSKRRKREEAQRTPPHFVVQSRNEKNGMSESASSANKQEGRLLNGISNAKMVAGLVTAFMASTVCDHALAAISEAPTAVSDNSSNFKFVVVCIAEAVALTGAAVGGVLARQRKVELEKINGQLRQINVNLRRQSRVESYAPNLTYAPVGSGRMIDSQVRNDPVRDELIQTLKTGKRWLREKNPAYAYGDFAKALPLAQQLKDRVEEKKAARGLGASCQRQGKYREAIKHHMHVLNVSKLTGENKGDTEAYGAIADCYTEIGDLETAGKYYDQYIAGLESDDTALVD